MQKLGIIIASVRGRFNGGDVHEAAAKHMLDDLARCSGALASLRHS